MKPPIRIVVADPHQVVVEALAARLAQEPDLEVVATAANKDSLQDAITFAHPTVVLSELAFADGGVFEAVSHAAPPSHPRLVILTEANWEVMLREVGRYVTGWRLKTEPVSAIVSAIREVAAGGLSVSPALRPRLRMGRRRLRFDAKVSDPVASLSERQLKAMRLFARGVEVREVARQLFLSEKGAESQRYRLMRKLRVKDRVELSRLAVREGFVSP